MLCCKHTCNVATARISQRLKSGTYARKHSCAPCTMVQLPRSLHQIVFRFPQVHHAGTPQSRLLLGHQERGTRMQLPNQPHHVYTPYTVQT